MERIVGINTDTKRCRLIDLDTGLEIPCVWAADDEVGLYAQYENDGGKILFNAKTNDIVSVTKEGNIRIVDMNEVEEAQALMGIM